MQNAWDLHCHHLLCRRVSEMSDFMSLSMRRLFRVIFIEHRVPVRAYRLYYDLLDSVGIHKIKVVTRNGLVIEGLSNSLWMYHETWDKDDYRVPGLELGPGMTVIDIGANQGFYSLYAASKGARVLAFEPSKTSFEILQQNVDRNKMTNLVSCFNVAVAATSGRTQFFEGFDKRGRFLSGSASIINENRGGSTVTTNWTRTISLDDVFSENNIESCDLVKFDCEGAEYQILAAASKFSFERIKNVALEFHNGQVDRLKESLERGGFEVISVAGEVAGLLKANNKAGPLD
jgi:FkbM family methyltransferase